VLVGGGIGVTPFASILKDLVNKTQSGSGVRCEAVSWRSFTGLLDWNAYEILTLYLSFLDEAFFGKPIQTAFFESGKKVFFCILSCSSHIQHSFTKAKATKKDICAQNMHTYANKQSTVWSHERPSMTFVAIHTVFGLLWSIKDLQWQFQTPAADTSSSAGAPNLWYAYR